MTSEESALDNILDSSSEYTNSSDETGGGSRTSGIGGGKGGR